MDTRAGTAVVSMVRLRHVVAFTNPDSHSEACLVHEVKMPLLTIKTNVARADIPADFLSEATKVFQELIGKPMQVSLTII